MYWRLENGADLGFFLRQSPHLHLLDCENEALRETGKRLQTREEACRQLEQTIKQSEAQIAQTRLLLEKEKAKYQSARRQQEVGANCC